MWFPQRSWCKATMERKGAEGLYGELHKDAPYHDGTFKKWAKERSTKHPYHYLDGVVIWAAAVDQNPDDHFTTDVNASPTPVIPEASGNEADSAEQATPKED